MKRVVVNGLLEIRQCPCGLIEPTVAVAPLDQGLDVAVVAGDHLVQQRDRLAEPSLIVELKRLVTQIIDRFRRCSRRPRQRQQNRQADFKWNPRQPHDPVLVVEMRFALLLLHFVVRSDPDRVFRALRPR